MNHLDIEQLPREELLKLYKEKEKALFTLITEAHEKDTLIQNLRIYTEELNRKKLEILDRLLEVRGLLNSHKDYHKQEISFMEEEITVRDEKIAELEEQLKMNKRRTL